MQINETALADILLQLSLSVEHCVGEIEHLYASIPFDDKMQQRYISGELRPDAAQHLSAIRLVRERLEAISRDLRK